MTDVPLDPRRIKQACREAELAGFRDAAADRPMDQTYLILEYNLRAPGLEVALRVKYLQGFDRGRAYRRNPNTEDEHGPDR